MRLHLLHPHLAGRTCGDCQTWVYPDKPGDFADKPAERAGRPVPRAAGTRPPCSYCPKQPNTVPEAERTPDTAVELSDRNWQAYWHHQECAAVGSFPDDPIVRRNAAVISRVEKDADTLLQFQLLTIGRRK